MRRIELSEETYLKASNAAEACGFDSVESYLAARVEEEATWLAGEVPDSFFTPEVMSAIDEGLADADAGRTHSLEEVREHFRQKSKEWRERAS